MRSFPPPPGPPPLERVPEPKSCYLPEDLGPGEDGCHVSTTRPIRPLPPLPGYFLADLSLGRYFPVAGSRGVTGAGPSDTWRPDSCRKESGPRHVQTTNLRCGLLCTPTGRPTRLRTSRSLPGGEEGFPFVGALPLPCSRRFISRCLNKRNFLYFLLKR